MSEYSCLNIITLSLFLYPPLPPYTHASNIIYFKVALIVHYLMDKFTMISIFIPICTMTIFVDLHTCTNIDIVFTQLVAWFAHILAFKWLHSVDILSPGSSEIYPRLNREVPLWIPGGLLLMLIGLHIICITSNSYTEHYRYISNKG